MATFIRLDTKVLNALLKNPTILLEDLGAVCSQTATEALGASKPLVPVSQNHDPKLPHLADTGFTDGPEINHERQTVTATAGYDHPEAGAIHEGFHYGFQTVTPPPHFLRKAAKPFRNILKKRVAKQIMATLERLFPKT